MDRIEALLAQAQQKVDESKATETSDVKEETRTGPIREGPAPPPPAISSPRSQPELRDSPSRSPRRGRRERSPLRDYGNYRDRSPSRSPDRKRYKGRSPRRWERDGGRSPPYGRDRDDFRDRRDGRGRGRGRRDRSPSPERLRRQKREDRDSRYKVVKEERDSRMLFVQGLPHDVFERNVEDWFENNDIPVRDVQLVVDKMRKFKGMAYVELYRKEDVLLSKSLSGGKFGENTLTIEEASASSMTAGTNFSPTPISNSPSEFPLRLYIGNLDYNITQDMLRDMMLQFGPLDSLRLQVEPTGKSKGHAFVQFVHKANALTAFHQLNATTIANRQIRCDFTNEARSRDPTLPPPPPQLGSKSTYYPGTGAPAPHSMQENARQAGTNVGSLEDETAGNSASRYSLMQHLAASSASSTGSITAANVSHSAIATQNNGAEAMAPNFVPVQIDKSTLPSPGTPTTCLLLKNLFDPSTETNPNFNVEIEEDVRYEAEQFGPVIHIFADKASFGDVYIRFKDVGAAIQSADKMHGRFFDGRVVRAEFLSPETYEAKFD